MTSLFAGGGGQLLCGLSGWVGHHKGVDHRATPAPRVLEEAGEAAQWAEKPACLVRSKHCKEEKALARGEHCVEGDEHLEGAGEAGVGDLADEEEPANGDGDGGEHGGSEGGEQQSVPEHLSLGQRGGWGPGGLEEQYQGGEEGEGVHCQAHVLLLVAKGKTVLGGVGSEEEQKSWEREDWSR